MRIGIDGDLSHTAALEHWHAQIQGAHTSIARLSSGLRINSAVDDAAGLAIGEALRARALGTQQAQRNAQDGINLLRVADGALAESTAIVQRLRVIAVQSANGTWSDAQRAGLQALVDAGLQGLDGIARATEYNTIHLLDGSRGQLTLQVGAEAGHSRTLALHGATATDLGLGTGSHTVTTWKTVTTTTPDQVVTETTPDQVITETTPDQVVTTAGPDKTVTNTTTTYTYAASWKNGTGIVTGAPPAGSYTAYTDGRLIDAVTNESVGSWDATNYVATFSGGATVDFASWRTKGKSGGGSFNVTATPHTTTTTSTVAGDPVTTVVKGTTTTRVVAGTTTSHVVKGTTTTSQVAETSVVAGSGLDVSSRAGAQAALEAIDAALALLSDHRSEIGAAETALTHTVDGLGAQDVLLTAAESRLRGADIAAEMRRLATCQAAAQASAEAVSAAIRGQYAAVGMLLGSMALGDVAAAHAGVGHAPLSAASHGGR